MKKPRIIAVFEDNLQEVNYESKLFNSENTFVSKRVEQSNEIIVSYYFSTKNYNDKTLRSMWDESIVSFTGIQRCPKIIDARVFEELLFSDDEILIIENEELQQKMKQTLGYYELVCPNLIVSFENEAEEHRFLLKIKSERFSEKLYYRVLNTDRMILVSLIFAVETVELGQIIQKGEYSRYSYIPTGIKAPPSYLTFEQYRLLSFSYDENTAIDKLNDEYIKEAQELLNAQRPPRIIFRITGRDNGQAIYNDILMLYSVKSICVKKIDVGDVAYISCYHTNAVNINALYYVLDDSIEINRYVHDNRDIITCPNFVERSLFCRLCFDPQEVLLLQPKEPLILRQLPVIVVEDISHDDCNYIIDIISECFNNAIELTTIESRYGANELGIHLPSKAITQKMVELFLEDNCIPYFQLKQYTELQPFIMRELSTDKNERKRVPSGEDSQANANVELYSPRPLPSVVKYYVFLDFEAYVFKHDVFLPSEIGVVVADKEEIIEEFHSLILPYEIDKEVLSARALARRVSYVEELTKIDICKINSENARTIAECIFTLEKICLKYNDFILVAKGPELEYNILLRYNSFLAGRLYDISQITSKMNFSMLHSMRRKKHYCAYHAPFSTQKGLYGEAVHCSLDDAFFLAQEFTNQVTQLEDVVTRQVNRLVIPAKQDYYSSCSYLQEYPEKVCPILVFECPTVCALKQIERDFRRIFGCKYKIKSKLADNKVTASMLYIEQDVPEECSKLFVIGKECRFFNDALVGEDLLFDESDLQSLESM